MGKKQGDIGVVCYQVGVSFYRTFVDSEDMKEAPSRLREVHIPMSAVNIECAVTLYLA